MGSTENTLSSTKTIPSLLISSRDMATTPRPLVPGIYAPLFTFYLENDEQDIGESLVPPV